MEAPFLALQVLLQEEPFWIRPGIVPLVPHPLSFGARQMLPGSPKVGRASNGAWGQVPSPQTGVQRHTLSLHSNSQALEPPGN